MIVEEVRDGDPDREYPAFVDGARRCPPEDVGSLDAYRARDLSHEDACVNNFKSSIYDNLTACESVDDFHRPVLGLSLARGGSIVVTAIKKHETSRLQLEPSATAPLNTPRR